MNGNDCYVVFNGSGSVFVCPTVESGKAIARALGSAAPPMGCMFVGDDELEYLPEGATLCRIGPEWLAPTPDCCVVRHRRELER